MIDQSILNDLQLEQITPNASQNPCFQLTTWAYITQEGNIRYQGLLKYGEVTIAHVMHKTTRLEVKAQISKTISKLIQQLSQFSVHP